MAIDNHEPALQQTHSASTQNKINVACVRPGTRRIFSISDAILLNGSLSQTAIGQCRHTCDGSRLH